MPIKPKPLPKRNKPTNLGKNTPQSNTLLTKDPKTNRNKSTSNATPMNKGKRGKGNGSRPSDIGIDRWNWMMNRGYNQ